MSGRVARHCAETMSRLLSIAAMNQNAGSIPGGVARMINGARMRQ